ncbi:MAG TPA: O-antigen ligase family protein [Rhizomicrobium sp.]|jgi:exopolysaccharide production protein ExoQ|nr:O-antigen ligase family protein [Rhizomicrobium sp.]
MANAFHVEAISWHHRGITLFGENRELGFAPLAHSPTRMVAWNQPVAITERPSERPRILDWDAIFAFALFVPVLFIVQFASYGALFFLFVTFVCAAARHRRLCTLLRDRWFVLLLPAWACTSALWSEVPFETLKHSAEFAITILAALLLASPRNPRAMLVGLFWAFVLYIAVSFVAGNTVAVGDTDTRAFSGLDESKNQMAAIAGTGLVISFFVFAIGLQRRSVLLCAIATAACVLESLATIAARSAGTLAASAVAMGALALLFVLRRAGKFGRGITIAAVSLGAFAVGAVFEFAGTDLLQWLANSFGKDPTLTGRTYLWYRARELVAESPLLGKGFGTFWQQSNLDAEGLWQFAKITARTGFNFHNTLYDSLVSVGWIGTFILLLTLVVGLFRLGSAYAGRPGMIACFWLSMAAYNFVRMPTECVGFNEFYFSTVLLYAALGASCPVATAPLLRPIVARLAFACRSEARRARGAAASAVARSEAR